MANNYVVAHRWNVFPTVSFSGFKPSSKVIIFRSILTTFKASSIFQAAEAFLLKLKIALLKAHLACPNW
jgi:hypothetical protein